MLIDLEKMDDFTKKYLRMLDHRLSQASLEIENEITNDNDDILRISNHYDALVYVFKKYSSSKQIEHMEFIGLTEKIVQILTDEEISNVRTTKALVNGSEVERTEARFIRQELYMLIDDYNYRILNAKSSEDIFYAIAAFHIKYLHIHPFEDSNGRSARILLTWQLVSNNLAPAIITREQKDFYCSLIENSDLEGMQKYLAKLSLEEFNAMHMLQDRFNKRQEQKKKQL